MQNQQYDKFPAASIALFLIIWPMLGESIVGQKIFPKRKRVFFSSLAVNKQHKMKAEVKTWFNLCKMTNNQHRNITANLNFIRTFLWIWINFHPAAPTGTKFLTQQYGRQIRLGQEHLAVSCREDTVIGEIVFKEIDRTNRHCKLSIHLKNDP